MASSGGDDVPPLEDLSELLEKANLMREAKTNTHKDYMKKNGEIDNIKKGILARDSEEIKKTGVAAVENKSMKENKGDFGGFKKGFLFSNTKPVSKSKSTLMQTKVEDDKKVTSSDDIPLIKPKQGSDQQWKMPEVQEAMKASQAFAQNKDWVTEDLLTKVMNNKTLAKHLSDPVFMQGVTDFQKNPQEALKKYQNNPEMQQFLKEFCGLMGQHFEGLSSNQASKPTVQTTEGTDLSVRSSTDPNQPTADDERRMQEILSKPEIREVLMDPQIQSLIDALRHNPHEAQSMLQRASAEQQKKIKKLVDVGLLQFQR